MKWKIALGALLMKRLWASSRSQSDATVTSDMGGIALLGDSITHLGRWELLFPGMPIWNFGISGERTGQLLARLNPVVRCSPHKLFILIGTNDLGVGIAVDEAVRNVDAMLRELRQRLPSTELYLQGVMPRTRKYAARMQALNAQYRQLADRHGARFIDLFPLFDDGSGQLRAALTDDKLHLNGAGYLAWREVIGPLIVGSRLGARAD